MLSQIGSHISAPHPPLRSISLHTFLLAVLCLSTCRIAKIMSTNDAVIFAIASICTVSTLLRTYPGKVLYLADVPPYPTDRGLLEVA